MKYIFFNIKIYSLTFFQCLWLWKLPRKHHFEYMRGRFLHKSIPFYISFDEFVQMKDNNGENIY